MFSVSLLFCSQVVDCQCFMQNMFYNMFLNNRFSAEKKDVTVC